VPVVAGFMESRNVAPIGCSVLVKPLLPVKIEQLKIRYTREPGVSMLMTQAAAEISSYIRGLGHPNCYSDGAINDTMLFAGASAVRGVECRAKVRWSVGHRYVTDSTLDPEEDYATWLEASVPCPTITITSTAGLIPRHRFADACAAVGVLNVGYLMNPEAIVFSEEI